MTEHRPYGSASFEFVAAGLVALHRLDRAGQDDSSEAESIRDSLDAPLDALNGAEKERAQWLSEDLYSIGEPPSTVVGKPMTPEAQRQLNEAIEARQSREWDRSLSLLRLCKDHVSPAQLSCMRGRIWEEIGYPVVAGAFFAYASESDPANANYRSLYMASLAESDPESSGMPTRHATREPLASHSSSD